MDYSFNEEQEVFNTSAGDFPVAECPKTLVREMAEDENNYQFLWLYILLM